MKTVYKGVVFALTAAILLLLCLTHTAFATEDWTGATPSDAEEIEQLAATPSDAEEVEQLAAVPSDAEEIEQPAATPSDAVEEEELLVATPSDAVEEEELLVATPSDAVEVKSLMNAPPKTVPEPDTAATAEELLEWLQEHENSEGTLRLTADIFLDDLFYMENPRKNITIEAGEFAIIATGKVDFWRGGLTVRGQGGERGVFRAAKGGRLSIGYMTIEAEEGFAVFQEEGAGLQVLQCVVEESAVHYSETPFVWRWKPLQVVVKPGQTAADLLPQTVKAYDVNRLGQMNPEEVPVVWELAEHESSEEQRLRFDAVGSAPGFTYGSPPVCTVIYDDYPLTFLYVNAKKKEGGQGESYLFSGTFSIPEDRLPFTITQDYSFDGVNWTVYEEIEVNAPDTSFGISCAANAGDIQRFPDVFIRLSWNDGGTMYYSNVLRFARDNMEKSEDHGGNRGGGTDIVDPPEPPEPEPEPGTTPPGTAEPENPPPETSEPETTPPPETSEPETTPPPETSDPTSGSSGNSGTDYGSDESGSASSQENSGGSHRGGDGSSSGITLKPDLPGGSREPEAAPPISVPGAVPGQAPASGLASEPVSEPVTESSLPDKSVVSSAVSGEEAERHSAVADTSPSRASSHAPSAPTSEPPDSTEVLAEPETEATLRPAPQRPDAGSAVAGLAAIAASMGAAALYLHPKAWKRLVGRLWDLFKR